MINLPQNSPSTHPSPPQPTHLFGTFRSHQTKKAFSRNSVFIRFPSQLIYLVNLHECQARVIQLQGCHRQGLPQLENHGRLILSSHLPEIVCHAARQARRLSAFTVLVWVAVSSNLIAACATFLFATGVLNESTPYYLFTLHLWAVQLHCVFQIMVSRIVLIWASPSHRQFLRWGIFVWTSVLITAAFSTWIPARLQVSKTFIKLNNIFYPTIRILCLLTNLFLSVTFIQSVKKTLVANGLEKYNKLLKFNAKIMGLSLLLDTVPIFLLRSSGLNKS